ncbi:MAG: TerB family tellurite resistance protein [Bacteroidota bacterium]
MNRGQITLALLHDLALLYLGLAHGADEDLDPHETMEIAAKLRRWQPDKDPALIDHVIREATLTYLNGANDQRLQEAVQILGNELNRPLLQSILADLVDIARADGTVVPGEKSFIREIADSWSLEISQP